MASSRTRLPSENVPARVRFHALGAGRNLEIFSPDFAAGIVDEASDMNTRKELGYGDAERAARILKGGEGKRLTYRQVG